MQFVFSSQNGFLSQQVILVSNNRHFFVFLSQLLSISSKISKFEVDAGNGTTYGWKDICFKIPIIAELTVTSDRTKRDIRNRLHVRHADDSDDNAFDFDDAFENAFSAKETNNKRSKPFNPVIDLDPIIFCGIVDQLPLGCLQHNILELWNFNENKINNLTKEDILNALARTNVSATTGHETDFNSLLGGVERNASGHIVSATGLLSHWMVYVNFANVNHDKIGNSAGTEDWV